MTQGKAKKVSVAKTPAKKKTTPKKPDPDPIQSLTVDQMMQILDETLNAIKTHDSDMQVTEIVEELDHKGRYRIKRKLEKKNLEAIKDVVVVDIDEIEEMLKEAENENESK